MKSKITISHLELATSIEQLDWILTYPFQLPEVTFNVAKEIDQWLQERIASLTVQSYAHNRLRHFSLMSAKKNVPLIQAAQKITQWMAECIPYFEEVLSAPNFHSPYIHCMFRIQAESNALSCSANLARRSYGWEDWPDGLDCQVGLGELYCHRLKNERCMLHFSSAEDIHANMNEEIEINGKTIETLIAEGQVF